MASASSSAKANNDAAAQPAVAVGRARRSLRSLVRPPLNGSIVSRTGAAVMREKELADLFRKVGASDPEGWARSQIEEGIPQLARYLFLRQAWRQVVSEDDASWIDAN